MLQLNHFLLIFFFKYLKIKMFKIKSNVINSIVFSGFFSLNVSKLNQTHYQQYLLTCFKPLFYYIGFSNVFFF